MSHRPPKIDCWSKCRSKGIGSAEENNFGLSVVPKLGPPNVRQKHRMSPSPNKLKRHLHLHHRNDRLSKQRAPLVDWKLFSFSPPRRKLSKQPSHSQSACSKLSWIKLFRRHCNSQLLENVPGVHATAEIDDSDIGSAMRIVFLNRHQRQCRLAGSK